MTTTNKEAKDFHKMIEKLKKEADQEEDRLIETLLYYDGETKLYSNVDKKIENVSDFPLKLFIRENEKNNNKEI